MPTTTFYDADGHRNLLLEDVSSGGAVQTNQHMIIHNGEALVLDPGGHRVFKKVQTHTFRELKGAKLTKLFLSHQDPDIVAAISGWFMTTQVEGWVSSLWSRFVPHFGSERLMAERLRDIPDEGMKLELGGLELLVIPAHFLHSAGNFHLYDPVSKILYTGDLGASLGQPYIEVPDFADHLQYMEGFHKRYMASTLAMKRWAELAATMDIEVIAPQHGACFRGKELVKQFIDWAGDLECGVDIMAPYKLPE